MLAMSHTSVDIQIGQMALERGWISQDQLREALVARAKGRIRLVEILVSKGYLDPTQVVQLRNVLAIEGPPRVETAETVPAPAPTVPAPPSEPEPVPEPEPEPEPPPLPDSAEARTSAAFRAGSRPSRR